MQANTPTAMTPEEISRAYNNRLLVPNFQSILAQWVELSIQARAALPKAHWDVPYGERPLNTLDIIPAERTEGGSVGAPILFFIHGGYWRMLDKSAQTFLAPHWSSRGAMVVIPNYTLAPTIGLDGISLEIVQALAWIWHNAHRYGGNRERIVVAGHSAGGHLTGMALQCQWPDLDPRLPRHVVRKGLAISGLFDLEPLIHCEWLMPDIRLTPELIAKTSPARLPPPQGRVMAAVAGELESSEFHRQNVLIEQAWGRQCVPLRHSIPARNHFDILLDLREPESELSRILGTLLSI